MTSSAGERAASGLQDPLVGFYGDDFTGSTDAMEALTAAGARTVLFLDPPEPHVLAAHEGLRAFGIAGRSRSLPADAMAGVLRPAFRALQAAAPAFVHYKICSTFDSSPTVGSIGRALDVGLEIFGEQQVPVIVGAPVLGRYQVFGHLFARSGLDTEPYRLDRHPTMSRHPVTPMREADLRLVLAEQTAASVSLVDAVQLTAGSGAAVLERTAGTPGAVLIDMLDEGHLVRAGELLLDLARRRRPQFVIGSSGVEYALAAHLSGMPGSGVHAPARLAPPAAVDRIVAVSGSCSPVTARQIGWAVARGFTGVPLETAALADPAEGAAECERVVAAAGEAVATGRNVIVHAAQGPDDPRLARLADRLGRGRASEGDRLRAGDLVAEALGGILREIAARAPVRRLAVTGGDTSGRVARALGVRALEMVAPLAPGSPLCRIEAPGTSADGLEVVFKGGQVGRTEFFGDVIGSH